MPGSHPKNIQIYLPDGNAQSVRIAEVTSRTVQVVQIPRQKLGLAELQKETQQIGVYFLLGESEDERNSYLTYIGRAENCIERIQGHHRHKDFWTTAVTVTSRFRSFTDAHVQQLEYECIQVAEEGQRFRLKNERIPDDPHASEALLAELRDTFEAVQKILSVLGFPFVGLSLKRKDNSE